MTGKEILHDRNAAAQKLKEQIMSLTEEECRQLAESVDFLRKI